MEFMDMIRVLRRWWWLIVSIVLLTAVVLWFRLGSASAAYEATVTVQLSAPQREEVPVTDQYPYINLRDELLVARNNFAEVLQSQEVYRRTIDQLGLEGKAAEYLVEMDPVRDADFVYVTVNAGAPESAAEIANTHVNAAIVHYGNLRARSPNAEKDLFGQQMSVAQQAFRGAEDDFAQFQVENGIVSLESELTTNQLLLEQLQMERDRRFLEETVASSETVAEVDKLIVQRQQELEQLMALAPTYTMLEESARQARQRYWNMLNNSIELGPESGGVPSERDLKAAEVDMQSAELAFSQFQVENGIVSLESVLATYQQLLDQLELERDRRLLEEPAASIDAVAEVDKLIAQRQLELDRLTALAPRYDMLEEQALEARLTYQHVASKYNEAKLKATVVQAANFIQVAEPAQPATNPSSDWRLLYVLALAGSLGIGVLLAFILEYISTVKTTGAPESDKVTEKGAIAPDGAMAPQGMHVRIVPSEASKT